MALTTLADLSTRILNILSKDSSSFTGYYTQSKVTDAINDGLDFIAASMMQAGEGWLQSLALLNTVAGVSTVALPSDCAIINEVRYLVNDTYVCLTYDDDSQRNQATVTGIIPYPMTYRLLGNSISFNPVPGVTGTGTIQLDYAAYTPELAMQTDLLNGQFSRGLLNYVKWRAASQLVSQTGEGNRAWEKFEQEWYGKMKEITSKRIRAPQTIKPFEY